MKVLLFMAILLMAGQSFGAEQTVGPYIRGNGWVNPYIRSQPIRAPVYPTPRPYGY